MGFFFGSDDKPKAKTLDDANITMDEREQIALGNIQPTYEAIMAFRNRLKNKDINATKKKISPQKPKKKSGIGNTDRLMKTMKYLQDRNKRIQDKGVIHGLFDF
jgi:hypothetical protein